MDLAELAAALRAAARDALARLPAEPWLHDKRLLAEHAEDDQLAAAAIEALLGLEPRTATAAHPPARIAAEARALAATETDEGRLGLLIGLATTQERHADELPDRNVSQTFASASGGDPIDEVVREAEAAAARGDARGAADAMRKAAELDRARTEAGDPWSPWPRPRDP